MKIALPLSTFSLVLCLFCSTSSYAQSLTYTDLQFALTHPMPEIKEKLLAKGLAYISTVDLDSTQQNKNHMYIKDADNINYVGFAVLTFKNEIYGSTITTLKLAENNKLIQEIKTLGFTLHGSEKFGVNWYTQYRKGGLEVEIQVGPTDIGQTMYNITLRDLAKTKLVYP